MIEEIIQSNLAIAYTLLALFSLLIGSFLNVVIYRLPKMVENDSRESCNLFFPRSFCPSCRAKIPAYHNIPVLSYCFLRGRCGSCNTKIPLQYPLVESLSVVLAIFASLHFGFNSTLLFSLCFIWAIIPLFFIDLRHQILPDSLTLGLLWLGLIANTQSLFTSLENAVLSAAGAYLVLWIFIQVYSLIRKKEGMGHGDFKLFSAFGAWFGVAQLPFILLLSSFLGVLIGGIYLHRKGETKDTPIPFGPFLCFAGVISLFYGNVVLDWYLK